MSCPTALESVTVPGGRVGATSGLSGDLTAGEGLSLRWNNIVIRCCGWELAVYPSTTIKSAEKLD